MGKGGDDATNAMLNARIASYVYQYCKELEGRHDGKVQIPNATVHVFTNLLIEFGSTLGDDLQSFAQHGKRMNISPDDVKLCARRNPEILEMLNTLAQELEQSKKSPVSKRKRPINKGGGGKRKDINGKENNATMNDETMNQDNKIENDKEEEENDDDDDDDESDNTDNEQSGETIYQHAL